MGEENVNSFRKCIQLRPPGMGVRRFFYLISNGICWKVVMGIHKTGNVAKEAM